MLILSKRRSLAVVSAVLGFWVPLLRVPSHAQSGQFSSSEARTHYEKALGLGEKSQWRGALLELNRALQYESNNPEILVELGITWGELKEWDQAIKVLKRAIELAPNSGRAHYNLAATLDRASPGQHLGIPEYRRALKIDPSDVGSLINLASNVGDRNSAEARKLLEMALETDPKNARAHFNLALLSKNIGDMQGTFKGLQKAVELEPESSEFRRQLLSLLLSESRWDEAIIQCQQMLKQNEADWNSHYTLGRILINQGKEEEGEKELQKAQEIRQSQQKRETVQEMINHGISALTQGKVEDGIKQFTSALEIDEGSSQACMYLGVSLAAAGRLDQGIEKLNKAIEMDPSSPRVHHNLGTLFLQAGRIDLAQREFEKALELDPYFPEAHNNLGLIFSRNNQESKAIDHFRVASELNPQYLEALFNLGLALRSINRVEEAVRAFREAAEVAPDSAQVQYALGMALKDKGDLVGAKQAMDRANTLQGQVRPNSNIQR
jgi:superkiller protein 3